MHENPIDWLPKWLWSALSDVGNKAGIWLVGGAVRDKLIGLDTVDFDFAVEGDGRKIARALANALDGNYYELDAQRGTGRSIVHRDRDADFVLDFASLRGGSILGDLQGRDFTLNALAISLKEPGALIDPLSGLQDLKDRVLRLCSAHALEDDPIRALRAARLAVQLEARIDSQTLKQIRKIKNRMQEPSLERVRDEIFRILSLTKPAAALRLLDNFGLLDVVFPELRPLRGLNRSTQASYDALEHSLAIVDHLSNLLSVIGNDQRRRTAADLISAIFIFRLGAFRTQLKDYVNIALSHGRSIRELLLLAALYHNVGKVNYQGAKQSHSSARKTASIAAQRIADRARDLKLGRSEIHWLKHTTQNQNHPGQVSLKQLANPRNLYRSLTMMDQELPGILLIFLAEFLAENDPPLDQEEWSMRIDVARALFDGFWNAAIDDLTQPPLANGDEIKGFLGIHPGPELGVLLEKLREAQYAGDITSKREALSLARKIQGRSTESKMPD